MASPSISVIMATYNHEAYVAEAVRSVLEQTHTDFEFLIVDDASADATPDIVQTFKDARIVFWRGTENLGSSARRNELIARAQGNYIAVQNSDDVWAPDKLALQFAFLEANPRCGAMFSRIAYIDANGAQLWANQPTQFDGESRSTGLWLRYLFIEPRNCFAHPTVMIRKACHEAVGGYDIRLRQVPDAEMWVRLLKRYAIHLAAEALVWVRWHGQNVSYTEPVEPRTRWYNEKALSSETFFDGMCKELLVEGFGDLLVVKDPPTEEHCDIEKALIYLSAECALSPIYNTIGMRRLYHLFVSPRHQALLVKDYRIDRASLERFSGQIDTFLRAFNVMALEEQGHEREARITELDNALAKREAQIAEFESVLAKREDQVGKLESVRERCEGQIAELASMLAKRVSQVTERDGALAKCEAQIAELESVLATREHQVAELESARERCEGQIAELESMLANRVSQVTELDGALAKSVAQIVELERDATKLQAALSALRQTSAEQDLTLTKRAIALEHLLAEAENQIINLSKKEHLLAEAQTDIANLSTHIAERDCQIEALRASTSWRVTAPLRIARQLIRRNS